MDREEKKTGEWSCIEYYSRLSLFSPFWQRETHARAPGVDAKCSTRRRYNLELCARERARRTVCDNTMRYVTRAKARECLCLSAFLNMSRMVHTIVPCTRRIEVLGMLLLDSQTCTTERCTRRVVWYICVVATFLWARI